MRSGTDNIRAVIMVNDTNYLLKGQGIGVNEKVFILEIDLRAKRFLILGPVVPRTKSQKFDILAEPRMRKWPNWRR